MIYETVTTFTYEYKISQINSFQDTFLPHKDKSILFEKNIRYTLLKYTNKQMISNEFVVFPGENKEKPTKKRKLRLRIETMFVIANHNNGLIISV